MGIRVVMIVQDVQENCEKNVRKNEGKTLKIVLGEYWCCAAAAKR